MYDKLIVVHRGAKFIPRLKNGMARLRSDERHISSWVNIIFILTLPILNPLRLNWFGVDAI